ncbi:MAG: hydrolase [Planctomycetota bacterium]|nr:MAG: hydrolase [Planctomycetota bacterium]
MAPETFPSRSPLLMSPATTALLVVDVQEKLLPLIDGNRRIAWNVRRLIDAAKVLDIPVVGTEQYPKGLGPTVPELAERLGEVPSKKMFSCRECGELFERLSADDRDTIVVCGIETHVCITQTAFDLLGAGWNVFLPVDAVGSRFRLDHEIALRRMETSGVVLTTTEAAMFEWCETAAHPAFKEISRLVREEPPADD